MAELTYSDRQDLRDEDFAIPEKRAYPIHDEAHARAALSRVSQFGTPQERERVEEVVERRYPGIRTAHEAGESKGQEAKEDFAKGFFGDFSDEAMAEKSKENEPAEHRHSKGYPAHEHIGRHPHEDEPWVLESAETPRAEAAEHGMEVEKVHDDGDVTARDKKGGEYVITTDRSIFKKVKHGLTEMTPEDRAAMQHLGGSVKANLKKRGVI